MNWPEIHFYALLLEGKDLAADAAEVSLEGSKQTWMFKNFTLNLLQHWGRNYVGLDYSCGTERIDRFR